MDTIKQGFYHSPECRMKEMTVRSVLLTSDPYGIRGEAGAKGNRNIIDEEF